MGGSSKRHLNTFPISTVSKTTVLSNLVRTEPLGADTETSDGEIELTSFLAPFLPPLRVGFSELSLKKRCNLNSVFESSRAITFFFLSFLFLTDMMLASDTSSDLSKGYC